MKRTKHNLSHYKMFSADMGRLIPISCYEILPGDSVQQNSVAFIRAAPMLAPPMSPVHARIHHFFVPCRLLWDGFEDFITGGAQGTPVPAFPTIVSSGDEDWTATKTLSDYLGVPPATTSTTVSALPFRAYNLIWNEYYRDQDLQTEVAISKGNGSDTTTSVDIQNCCWEKDYFTVARPWEQKGPQVTIPLQGLANVGTSTTFGQTGDFVGITTSRGIRSTAGGDLGVSQALVAHLASGTSGVNISLMREALALQRWEEARAMWGSRYTEYLAYLGVRSSDARLQRPEYLGGGSTVLQFSEVLQTGTGTTPVGTLRGHGIASMRSNRFRRYFEEHGFVFTLLSVKPRTLYNNIVPRMFYRFNRDEWFTKEFELVGAQEIYNREVYRETVNPTGIFGYVDRFQDYRSIPHTIAGDYRTTLDFWHFARMFGSAPALNADFVKCVPPERPFAVPSEDVLWIMARNSVVARRMVGPSGQMPRTF